MCKDISQFLWRTVDLLLEVALRVSGADQECFPDHGSQLTQQFVFLFLCLTLHYSQKGAEIVDRSGRDDVLSRMAKPGAL